MHSNVQRVIEIPELLALIIHEFERKELCNLMLISKYFFHYVGPLAWKSVPRIDVIMRLISGAKVKFKYLPASYKYYIWTTFFVPQLDLSRYAIYAPWIQELEIYGGYHVEIKKPHLFLDRFHGRPVLPNLRRLTANTTAPVESEDLLGLFNMFTSPSLREIRTIIPAKGFAHVRHSRVQSSGVPAFLEKIKNTCPRIEALEFYPNQKGLDSYTRYTPNDQCRSTLSSFTNLSSFSSTTFILEPTFFGVLGGLPHLESLGIRGTPTERPVLDEQVSIPQTWFPSLKNLRLYDVNPIDIQVLWKQPVVVRNLISLIIHTDDTSRRNRRADPLYRKNWVGPFLEALAGLSPSLRDVDFYMGYLDNRIRIPREDWEFFGGDKDIIITHHIYRAKLGIQDCWQGFAI